MILSASENLIIQISTNYDKKLLAVYCTSNVFQKNVTQDKQVLHFVFTVRTAEISLISYLRSPDRQQSIALGVGILKGCTFPLITTTGKPYKEKLDLTTVA